jgi:hypothetical protein
MTGDKDDYIDVPARVVNSCNWLEISRNPYKINEINVDLS